MTRWVKRKGSGSNSSSDSREVLQQHLLQIPFNVYQVTVFLLLQKLGYRSVRFLGRKYRRGRTIGISADFVASWPSPVGELKALVSLKQEARLLQRRYIDEMRGALLREGFGEGIIVTTGTVSDAAREAIEVVPSLTISTVDGQQLAALMIAHQLGTTGDDRFELDKEFFRRLMNVHFGTNQ